MKTDSQKTGQFAERLRREFPDICYPNEPLASHATYRVGGPADVFVVPETLDDLEAIVRKCVRENIPFFVLGEGANVLIHDEGFRGVVISLDKCCHQLFHKENLLYAGAGVKVRELVEYCEKHALGGLDFLSGIPGTVGGALIMNAGAFVGEIGERVIRIDALDEQGRRIQISREEAGFGYRRADGLGSKVLLGCWLGVEPADANTLRAARENYLQRRAEKQPLDYPSCGSVFKRPPGDYAGRLIEAAGCKGLKIGGAIVSEKHANFILNLGNATADDIFQLIQAVQKKVYQKFGIWLEPEVKFIGFSDSDLKKIMSPDETQKEK